MADKFASVAGSGAHDGSSAGNAWTIAEATAAVVAGDTVNVLAGTYIANDSASSAVMDLDVPGTVALWITWRAYSSAPGDFAEKDTPPVILNAGTNALVNCVNCATLTGDAFNQFEGFQFTGASGVGVDGGSITDQLGFMGCKFDSNGGKGFAGDNELYFVGCEFTGNTGGAMDMDGFLMALRCKFHDELFATGVVRCNTGTFINCQFYDLGASEHIRFQAGEANTILGCTFDGGGDIASSAAQMNTSTTIATVLYNNIFFNLNIGVEMISTNFILNRGNNLFSSVTTPYSTLALADSDISNTTDPFLNSAANDYRLVKTGAAIKAGIDGGT